MTAFPQEINVLLGKAGYEKIQAEEWGAFDLFRRLILENSEALEKGLGIRLARPFYEKFVQHLLMFDDVFLELNAPSDTNETALHILDHIKSQLAGRHYQKLHNREVSAHSTVVVARTLIERVLARRTERNSFEALLKRKFLLKQFEPDGANFLFTLRGEAEISIMRDTLAYVAMVEALQTSIKEKTRIMGDRLAKENYLRIMLAHHILDTREGFRVKGEVLDKVRQVLDALDRDNNGLLSLLKAGETIQEDVSAQEHPELWKRLRSYDENGDGFLTAQEQIRLKEAIAGLIQRGIEFDKNRDNVISFEEAEDVLSKELPPRS